MGLVLLDLLTILLLRFGSNGHGESPDHSFNNGRSFGVGPLPFYVMAIRRRSPGFLLWREFLP